jgi:glycosyltransferase involved in cell wall biosynthesis
MKVLHVLKTSEGGAWAWRQMRELKALGVEVEVILPDVSKMNQKYHDIGVPVHLLNCDIANLRTPRKFLASRRAINGLIKSIKPDIVHSHFVGTTLFLRLAIGRNSGPLRVFQVPGPLHLENRLTRFVEVASAGIPDYWLASCKLTQKIYLSTGIAANRVDLSYYGTDTKALMAGLPGKLRSTLPFSKTTKLIGMVAYAYRPKRWLGRRRGIKGHEDLIDAVAQLRQSGLDVAVVFAGGAWLGAENYFDSIKAYAQEKLGERAVFLGIRSDIPDIYADLDVAVHPSHSENLGGAAESLLALVPTVATNIGGFPDIVINGRTGWLCDAQSPVSLAAAIEDVLRNPEEARTRTKMGHGLVRRELDVRRTAAQVYEQYISMLSPQSAVGLS